MAGSRTSDSGLICRSWRLARVPLQLWCCGFSEYAEQRVAKRAWGHWECLLGRACVLQLSASDSMGLYSPSPTSHGFLVPQMSTAGLQRDSV